LPDAVVGPLFACVLAEQSRRNKGNYNHIRSDQPYNDREIVLVGDRFWFENGKMPHSFNEGLIFEIDDFF